MVEDETRETTSLKVKPSLWKDCKKRAIDMDIDLADFVESALVLRLQGTKEAAKK